MIELSLDSREIWQAFKDAPDCAENKLAAALRAVADQGEILFDAYDSPVEAITVEDLLTLAKELEAS